ncbi:hypothetical protein [Lacrimispora sp. 38-1]|uniref:hypothetical protein n=1 Tax=Lacrimispora sp. 38-1 TaxID=3125778 RepID=UPI003CF7E430
MKLLDKQIVTVQVYAGRKFETMIGSNDGLIGILINSGEYIWAPMDSSIANVTSKGKVTALSKGLVLISEKDADGNIFPILESGIIQKAGIRHYGPALNIVNYIIFR